MGEKENYSSISPKSVEAIIVYHADHVVTEIWAMTKNIDISFSMEDDSR